MVFSNKKIKHALFLRFKAKICSNSYNFKWAFLCLNEEARTIKLVATITVSCINLLLGLAILSNNNLVATVPISKPD